MDTYEAVALLLATLNQWRAGIKEGVGLEEHRSLLLADIERMLEAASVLSDWLPSK